MSYKQIIFTFSIIIFGLNLFSQIIPDDNFREEINEVLEQPVDYEPTITDLNSLTGNLNINNISIFSIEGAQYLTNLESLQLYSLQISDISPLAGLTNLTLLDLQRNNIVDISALSNLTNLTYLNLYRNDVGNIFSLFNLVNLSKLNLSHNEISDISVLSNLPNLSWLFLSCNEITDISALSYMPLLQRLYMSYNQISDTSYISEHTNLIFLELDNNLIENISGLSNLVNLTDLALDYNQINDITALSNLTNVEKIDLYDNQISDISALTTLTNLEELQLSNNQIVNISALANLTNLMYLYLSDNQIIDISSLTDLTSLVELILADNQISNISPLSYLTNLNYLQLQGNLITDIYPLVENTGLGFADWLYLHHYGSTNPVSFESLEVQIPILQTRGFDTLIYPFQANANAACYPNPMRNVVNVFCDSEFVSWQGMGQDTVYEVFLGESADELESIGEGIFTGDNTYIADVELQQVTEYWWRVKSITGNEVLWSGMWNFSTDNGLSSNNEMEEIPEETILHSAYPNPFNPSTTISFFVKENENAIIDIFNLKGQVIKSFPTYTPGNYSVEWNGKDNKGDRVSSGVYFYKLKSESTTKVRKMLMLK